MSSVANDNADEGHFEFGENWRRFLSQLNDGRIEAAVKSMRSLLRRETLAGTRFLDAGSGSGLFSLSANRMGANVTSFDLDPSSVACAKELKSRFSTHDSDWKILSGSLLDGGFLTSLGEFDVIYCWGVAHHTGDMWRAIGNLIPLVKPGGNIVLAIYNDEDYVSRIWRGIKQIYQRLPQPLRPIFVASIGAWTFCRRFITTTLASLLRLLTLRNPNVPFVNWIREGRSRGMHGWYDLVDWVGGWPFEVAKPEAIFRFMRDRGFTLTEMTTSGGHGCNEFVFVRLSCTSEMKSD